MTLKRRITFIFFCIPLILNPLIAPAHETQSYGLEFMAHNVEKEFRTGLDLTSGEKIRISSGENLEFDIKFRHENENFGFIFRMVQNSKAMSRRQNIDLISDLSSDNVFSIVMNRKIILQVSKADINNLSYNDWHHVSVCFGKNSISMAIDDFTTETNTDIDFHGKYLIYFGRNDDPEYFTREVPPMTIANVSLSRNGNAIGRWNLDHHSGNISPDTVGGHDATATNPVWNTDKFAYWEKIAEFTAESRPQIAFSNTGDRLYIAKGDSIHIFNIASGKISRIKNNGGEPFNTMSNNMVCLPASCGGKILLSYCLETKKHAVFDASTLRWDNRDSSAAPLPRFWHHNHCILDDGRVAVFGGYGFHQYKSVLQVFAPDSWNAETDSADLSQCISPRYLSAMAHDKEGNLYIFGGYGSRSGNQREFPTNCFDLYKVNSADRHCDLIRTFNPGEKFTCSNSMIFSQDSLSFYVLAYNNMESSSEIQLKRIPVSLSEDIEDLGNCIPYYFNDTESYCELAYYKEKEQLIAVTSHISKKYPGRSEINLYTINFPPISLPGASGCKSARFPWGAIICILSLCLVSAVSVMKLRSNKNKKQITAAPDISPALEKAADTPLDEHAGKQDEAIHRSEISLLGGFQVFDADGQDITGNFTKTLKHLFLLILLYTVKDGKGISSQNLTDILWFDKYEESARNNRNVNIRKLRILLSKIGGISISNENSYWRIDTDPGIFSCDYMEVQKIMDKKNMDLMSENERAKLLALLSKGALLIFTQEEWVDNFKSDFSAKVINFITAMAKDPEVKNNPSLIIKIADIILIHDSIDEDAVCMKCRALTELGRNGLARKAFNQFCSEYERLMGQHSLLTFEKAAGIS